VPTVSFAAPARTCDATGSSNECNPADYDEPGGGGTPINSDADGGGSTPGGGNGGSTNGGDDPGSAT
jgi:hypothetical protein